MNFVTSMGTPCWLNSLTHASITSSGAGFGGCLTICALQPRVFSTQPAPLSWPVYPASNHKQHVVLHKALKAAVADGLIPRNAAAGLKLPRITREEIDPLTEEEARRLLETVRGARLEALYVLALSTGMRLGELLALKWEDVDLEDGRLRVRRTLTHAGKSFVLGEPKTKNSRRTIRLTKGAISALKAHLSRQLEEMERMGSLYQPGGLIFATEGGTIVNPSNLRNRSFKPLLKRADLQPIRFHDLRHTCATLLLSKSVNPKVVSEMLGHASISITLDIYSHLLPDMQEKAVAALENMLSYPRCCTVAAQRPRSSAGDSS
jgi:integrase